MKWIYFGLAVAAGGFAGFLAIDGVPPDQPDGIRVCVTASLVNFAIFLAMHYAKKYADKRDAKNGRVQPK
jgi:hypothetical protein